MITIYNNDRTIKNVDQIKEELKNRRNELVSNLQILKEKGSNLSHNDLGPLLYYNEDDVKNHIDHVDKLLMRLDNYRV